MMYGYARVSAPGQDHAAQVAALTAAGCERIYSEKASAAAGRRRPALHQVLAVLGPGDVLVVTKMNRLARSAMDGLNTIAAALEKGAGFKSLGDPWADTTTAPGRFGVTVMLGMAELDREMILERTGEGRRNARARGVRLGRPPTLNATQRQFMRDQQALPTPPSLTELAAIMGVSKSTIVRANRTGPAGDPATPVWHAPTCAVFTSGAGNEVRCTCGGVAHGARGLQLDIEEVTGPPAPP